MMLRRSAAAFVISALAVGCSDSTDPPALGGLDIHIAPATGAPPGTACSNPGHTTTIPNPIKPPTTTDPGARVKDGEGGSVACSVSGGDPASFTAKIFQGTTSFTMIGSVSPGGK